MTGQQKILVYDRDNAEGMAFLLERLGYSTRPVSTVHELFKALISVRFDLLILEICDPQCQGFVDEVQILANCKVLFTTCGEEGHGYPLPTGEECVVEKPIDLMQFAQTIRQLLGQSVQ